MPKSPAGGQGKWWSRLTKYYGIKADTYQLTNQQTDGPTDKAGYCDTCMGPKTGKLLKLSWQKQLSSRRAGKNPNPKCWLVAYWQFCKTATYLVCCRDQLCKCTQRDKSVRHNWNFSRMPEAKEESILMQKVYFQNFRTVNVLKQLSWGH